MGSQSTRRKVQRVERVLHKLRLSMKSYHRTGPLVLNERNRKDNTQQDNGAVHIPPTYCSHPRSHRTFVYLRRFQ